MSISSTSGAGARSLLLDGGAVPAGTKPPAEKALDAAKAEFAALIEQREAEVELLPDDSHDANAHAKTGKRVSPHQAHQRDQFETRRHMRPARLMRVFQAVDGALAHERLHADSEQLLKEAMSGENHDRDLADLAEHRTKDPLRRYILLCMADLKLKARMGADIGAEKLPAQIVELMQLRVPEEGTAAAAAYSGAAKVREAIEGRLAAAMRKTLTRHRRRIAGGLNTAESIAAFSEQIAERDAMRDIYYDTIVTGRSIQDTFSRLLAAFGSDRFERAVQTLRHAIVEDMSARMPSSNAIQLEAYFRALDDSRKLNSLIKSALRLAEKTRSTLLRSNEGMASFLREVMRYAEGPPAVAQYRKICETVAGKEAMDTDSVRQHVKDFLLHEVPLSVWKTIDIRNAVVNTPWKTVPAPGTPWLQL